ncbi:MAG: 1-(5-phosphoribosyl)-5-((5-phosphoribosylamino)methylideneamino)imidazole-4-carboxamide isomerase [Deltaproteobacteria bacterium]|nr:MAG: 1-(5-phosphoribosyl)-5-((5-phosphoribosylamino)methylideneamino)imidazole-4-carboxamide isomerase [Deltaproteobacteria bacterium]
MFVIPAIDLKEGRCVRLRQGRMEEETIYSTVPQQVAARWESLGAEWIHVVDLDGAMAGRPVNIEAIKEIRKQVRVPLQLGGGIRDLETIEEWLSFGIERVVLGTAACEDPSFVREACQRYPGKIVVGIDARQGEVMVRGWRSRTGRRAVDLAKEVGSYGVAAIIFTDISRDGMGEGINLKGAKEVAQAVEIPLIVSGGVTSLEDIRVVRGLVPYGVAGVIVGRALYEGTLDLAEAIRVAKGS